MDFLKKLLEAGKITQEEYDSIVSEFEAKEQLISELRKEAAGKRIKLKETNKTLETFKKIIQDIGDKLGVDIDDEEGVEKLQEVLKNFDPTKKVDVTKIKEYEAKLNRALKEKEELEKRYQEEHHRRIDVLKNVEIQRALGKFDVFDREVVGEYIKRQVELDEDGKVKFKADDGVLLDLEEGLKDFFSKKPNLLKAQGQEGSGTPPNSISAVLKQSKNADDVLRAAGFKK